MRRIVCKNDNSAYFHFLIMSPGPYSYFIFDSGAQLCNRKKYLMVLGRIIEQVNMERPKQECQNNLKEFLQE